MSEFSTINEDGSVQFDLEIDINPILSAFNSLRSDVGNEIIQTLISATKQAAKKTLKSAGNLGVSLAINDNSFRNISLWKQTEFHNISDYQGFVKADIPYAKYVEEGNNQNGSTIFPVNAKALRFVIDGEVIFSKSAKTYSGFHFMDNAAKKVDKKIDGIFESHFNKLL